ncbi:MULTISPECIES: hypothetical protein [Butyricimonas]|jgi:hypothetical protein|uniref:Molecular chaperone DnaK (HSP70) n=2 Tax=Butyricimonas faecihominis TaxID=1472416 RepID=A0A7W6HV74_9BACT|nr:MULTISPECIES: hypothetical protein [Butyricimonas]KAB1504667.1 hypothetical protein F8R21_16915 [Butyricimonas faecihominis]MBB4025068.1 molecular chaperone DnaK (HSP70) [Butyricimonas faecihominis]WOF08607.1 hypothetical protein F1611_09480 [Butyricimonas faecihominis]BEI55244.1 hypothetical protein Bfae18676_02190 [Butyricimonas faecihominis]GGJ14837.1 hypothetical protein GCM10007041_00100 [Butyricimonas faecihominis]
MAGSIISAHKGVLKRYQNRGIEQKYLEEHDSIKYEQKEDKEKIECLKKFAKENNLILERKKNNPSKNVDKDTKSEINELITSITSKIKDNKKLSDKDIDSFIEQLNNLIQTIKSEKSKIIDRMKQTIEAEIEKYKKELDRLNSIN